MQPYARFLLLNGALVIGFLLLYFSGYALKNMGLLLLSVFFACVSLPLEILLGLVAAARGRLILASLYGAVSIALFFANSWLLEQAE